MFWTRGPVDPTTGLFVGRAAELRTIESWITYVNCVGAVLGPRQTGKTSLLHQLRHTFGERYAFVLVNLQAIEGANVNECYRYIAEEIAEQLAPLLQAPAPELPDTPIQFLRFLRQCANQTRAMRIVVLLDEIGALPAETTMSLAHRIRAVFTSRLDKREYGRYVFIISGAVDMLRLTTGTTSPLWNVTDSSYMADLTEAEVAQLLALGCACPRAAVDPALVAAIYGWSGGHPYWTQLLAERLQASEQGLVAPAVDGTVELLLQTEDRNLRHMLRSLDQADAALWAVVKQVLAGAAVPFNRINPTVAELELIGVVRNEGGHCVIRNRIYRTAIERYLATQSVPQSTPPPLPPDPPPDDSERLRYVVEHTFPHPIAHSLFQLQLLADWQGQLPQLLRVLEVTMRHLGMIALAEYLACGERDPALNAALRETMHRPLAVGHWAGVLREVLTFLQARAPRVFAPELLATYLPAAGDKSASATQAIVDELIPLRNMLIHKTAQPPTYEQFKRFQQGVFHLLRAVVFLKDYPLVAAESASVENGVKTHRCQLLAGFHDDFTSSLVQCDLDLERGRVAMLNPRSGELLYLYPLYVRRACTKRDCDATHLFHFAQQERGRIVYENGDGHRLNDKEAWADLEALLEGPAHLQLRLKGAYLRADSPMRRRERPAGQRIGAYEIVAYLRRGGMADVYRVRRVGMEMAPTLALKLLAFQFISDSTLVERFQQEARLAQGLAHPQVTRIIDCGEDVADHYLVMELADGWSLPAGRLALDVGDLPRPLDELTALAIVKQVCQGLDYLHGRQVVHRDIKPGNLLLFANQQVKLADFGLARSWDSLRLTLTGLSVGTPEYMSPEQAQGVTEITAASDIYSLGVVLYELLTGQTPFKRANPWATALAQLHEPVVAPRVLNPMLAPELEAIVLACLAKTPHERFPSARALLDALAAYEQR